MECGPSQTTCVVAECELCYVSDTTQTKAELAGISCLLCTLSLVDNRCRCDALPYIAAGVPGPDHSAPGAEPSESTRVLGGCHAVWIGAIHICNGRGTLPA